MATYYIDGCPIPADDAWFNQSNVKFSTLEADFTSDSTLFYGKIGARVYEKYPASPSTVIDVDDTWHVNVHINVAGLIPTLWCGWWCISLCLESLCGEEDYRFPQPSRTGQTSSIEVNFPKPREGQPPPAGGYCCWLVPVDSCCGLIDATITVPPNTVQESVCGAPYEVTVIASFITRCQIKAGDPNDPRNYKPAGIAASVQLPMLTFYNEEGGAAPSSRFNNVRFGNIEKDVYGAMVGHLGLGIDVVGTVHDVQGNITVETHPVAHAPGPFQPLNDADKASLIRALDTYIEANPSANPLWKNLLAELQR